MQFFVANFPTELNIYDHTFYDTVPVNFISNIYDSLPVYFIVIKHNIDTWVLPLIGLIYNVYMGGVDNLDHTKLLHLYLHKLCLAVTAIAYEVPQLIVLYDYLENEKIVHETEESFQNQFHYVHIPEKIPKMPNQSNRKDCIYCREQTRWQCTQCGPLHHEGVGHILAFSNITV